METQDLFVHKEEEYESYCSYFVNWKMKQQTLVQPNKKRKEKGAGSWSSDAMIKADLLSSF